MTSALTLSTLGRWAFSRRDHDDDGSPSTPQLSAYLRATEVWWTPPEQSREYRLKRSLDVFGALVGLVLLAPMMGVCALVVKLSSDGPALFRQQRIGFRGTPFTILKFRTMQLDNRGLPLTVSGDRRVTRMGNLLRRSKLDEFPQLINVLLGEMSLVGPRPEVPELVTGYAPYMDVIAVSKPGITSYASIKYVNEADLLQTVEDPLRLYHQVIMPDKMRYERIYCEHQGICTDLRVILVTLLALLYPPVRRRFTL